MNLEELQIKIGIELKELNKQLKKASDDINKHIGPKATKKLMADNNKVIKRGLDDISRTTMYSVKKMRKDTTKEVDDMSKDINKSLTKAFDINLTKFNKNIDASMAQAKRSVKNACNDIRRELNAALNVKANINVSASSSAQRQSSSSRSDSAAIMASSQYTAAMMVKAVNGMIDADNKNTTRLEGAVNKSTNKIVSAINKLETKKSQSSSRSKSEIETEVKTSIKVIEDGLQSGVDKALQSVGNPEIEATINLKADGLQNEVNKTIREVDVPNFETTIDLKADNLQNEVDKIIGKVDVPTFKTSVEIKADGLQNEVNKTIREVDVPNFETTIKVDNSKLQKEVNDIVKKIKTQTIKIGAELYYKYPDTTEGKMVGSPYGPDNKALIEAIKNAYKAINILSRNLSALNNLKNIGQLGTGSYGSNKPQGGTVNWRPGRPDETIPSFEGEIVNPIAIPKEPLKQIQDVIEGVNYTVKDLEKTLMNTSNFDLGKEGVLDTSQVDALKQVHNLKQKISSAPLMLTSQDDALDSIQQKLNKIKEDVNFTITEEVSSVGVNPDEFKNHFGDLEDYGDVLHNFYEDLQKLDDERVKLDIDTEDARKQIADLQEVIETYIKSIGDGSLVGDIRSATGVGDNQDPTPRKQKKGGRPPKPTIMGFGFGGFKNEIDTIIEYAKKAASKIKKALSGSTDELAMTIDDDDMQNMHKKAEEIMKKRQESILRMIEKINSGEYKAINSKISDEEHKKLQDKFNEKFKIDAELEIDYDSLNIEEIVSKAESAINKLRPVLLSIINDLKIAYRGPEAFGKERVLDEHSKNSKGIGKYQFHEQQVLDMIRAVAALSLQLDEVEKNELKINVDISEIKKANKALTDLCIDGNSLYLDTFFDVTKVPPISMEKLNEYARTIRKAGPITSDYGFDVDVENPLRKEVLSEITEEAPFELEKAKNNLAKKFDAILNKIKKFKQEYEGINLDSPELYRTIQSQLPGSDATFKVPSESGYRLNSIKSSVDEELDNIKELQEYIKRVQDMSIVLDVDSSKIDKARNILMDYKDLYLSLMNHMHSQKNRTGILFPAEKINDLQDRANRIRPQTVFDDPSYYTGEATHFDNVKRPFVHGRKQEDSFRDDFNTKRNNISSLSNFERDFKKSYSEFFKRLFKSLDNAVFNSTNFESTGNGYKISDTKLFNNIIDDELANLELVMDNIRDVFAEVDKVRKDPKKFGVGNEHINKIVGLIYDTVDLLSDIKTEMKTAKKTGESIPFEQMGTFERRAEYLGEVPYGEADDNSLGFLPHQRQLNDLAETAKKAGGKIKKALFGKSKDGSNELAITMDDGSGGDDFDARIDDAIKRLNEEMDDAIKKLNKVRDKLEELTDKKIRPATDIAPESYPFKELYVKATIDDVKIEKAVKDSIKIPIDFDMVGRGAENLRKLFDLPAFKADAEALRDIFNGIDLADDLETNLDLDGLLKKLKSIQSIDDIDIDLDDLRQDLVKLLEQLDKLRLAETDEIKIKVVDDEIAKATALLKQLDDVRRRFRGGSGSGGGGGNIPPRRRLPGADDFPIRSFPVRRYTGPTADVGNQFDSHVAIHKAVKAYEKIKEKLNEIKDEYKKLANTISKVTNKITAPLKKISSGLKGVAGGVKTAWNKITSIFKKGAKDCEKATNGLSLKLKDLLKTALSFGSLYGLINIGKQAVVESQELAQAESKLTALMKQRMGATNETVKAIRNLAAEQAKAGVVSETAMVKGAEQLSMYVHSAKALKELMPAIANMTARRGGLFATPDDAMEIATQLGEAIREGTTTPLEQSGIYLSEAEIEKFKKLRTEEERAKFLADEIAKSVGNINEALANTPHGQIAQLKNNFKSLLGTLGTLLVNVIQPIVKWLNVIVVAANNALKALGNMLGFDMTGGGLTGVEMDTPAPGDSGIDDTKDSIDDTKESLEEAEEAAEKFKGALMGFDEINILSNNLNDKDKEEEDPTNITPGKGGQLDPGEYVPPEFKEGENIFAKFGEKMKAFIDEFLEPFKKAWELYGNDLKEAWEGLKDSFKNFCDSLASFLKSVWDNGKLLLPL